MTRKAGKIEEMGGIQESRVQITKDSVFETTDLIISTNLNLRNFVEKRNFLGRKCDFEPVEHSYTTNRKVFVTRKKKKMVRTWKKN